MNIPPFPIGEKRIRDQQGVKTLDEMDHETGEYFWTKEEQDWVATHQSHWRLMNTPDNGGRKREGMELVHAVRLAMRGDEPLVYPQHPYNPPIPILYYGKDDTGQVIKHQVERTWDAKTDGDRFFIKTAPKGCRNFRRTLSVESYKMTPQGLMWGGRLLTVAPHRDQQMMLKRCYG